MVKNYYQILCINKDASEEDIKKSYKKLAIKWHPDKNPDNKEEASEKFKEISEAYQVLSDPEKRKIYDNYGEEGIKNNDFHSNNAFNSADDIFKKFFGNQNSPFSHYFDNHFSNNRNEAIVKTESKIINIPFTLKDCYNGFKRKITLKVKCICKKCDGIGGLNTKNCEKCHGKGVCIFDRHIGPGMIQRFQNVCDSCNGNKIKIINICDICNGNKTINEEKQFLLVVDKGVENEDKKIFENIGDQQPNKITGDIIFVMKEEENKLFKRVGADLIYNYYITLGDSIIGTTVLFNHINDEKITLKEHNIIKHNSYTIIKNKGLPIKDRINSFGNLYIIYNIEYPTKILSNEDKNIIKKILPTSNITINNNNPEFIEGELNDNFNIKILEKKHFKDKKNENRQEHYFSNMHDIFNLF